MYDDPKVTELYDVDYIVTKIMFFTYKKFPHFSYISHHTNIRLHTTVTIREHSSFLVLTINGKVYNMVHDHYILLLLLSKKHLLSSNITFPALLVYSKGGHRSLSR